MKISRPSLSAARRKERRIALFSLMPIFLFHFILIVLPSINTLFSSFTNWNGLGTKDFIGLENYKELIVDPNFSSALMNNIKWMALFLTIPIILGLTMGYIISKIKKGQIFYRAFYFLPYIISAAIAGKVFAALYNPYFGINVALENMGLTYLIRDWLSPDHSLVSVAFVDMWHWWGFLLVIFLSSLQQIDPCLYESAEVEGANELQKMWYITLPGIQSTLIFIVLVTMVWSFSTFEYVWVMTKGGPGSEILSTLLYKNALFKYRAGYACSISIFQGLMALVIFAGFGIIRKRMEESL